jgi:hypothetical protein
MVVNVGVLRLTKVRLGQFFPQMEAKENQSWDCNLESNSHSCMRLCNNGVMLEKNQG